MTSDTAWIKAQPKDNLLCRDTGHQWTHSTVRKVPIGYERDLLCNSCGTLKTQVLDERGGLIASRLSYDKSYARPKGNGPFTSKTRAAIRLRNLKDSA